MKKISLLALGALLCVALATPTLAKNDNDKAAAVRQDKVNKESVTSTSGVYSPRALSVWGEVTAVSSNTLPADLTVKASKVAATKMKDFTGAFPAKDSLVVVHLTANTKIVRKYSGRADFSGLAVGDKVDVHGKLQTDGTINASAVKNNSVEQRERAVKQLQLKKQVLEKRVQAARDTLAKLLAQLEEVLKKLIDSAPVTTTTPTATTTPTPSATTTP